jgi:hypothetical protein
MGAPMRTARLLTLPLLAALALALAVALGGCMSITFAGSGQPQSMGPLTLTVDACASDSPPDCPPAANGVKLYAPLSTIPGDPSVSVQMLLGVRLPQGIVPPDDIVATAPGAGGGNITYRRSTSYEGQLQAFEPAPAGERWWGWISDAFSYKASGPQTVAISFQITLPRPADGGPYPSPLPWRPVVGGRGVDPVNSLPATRPVNCGATPSDFYGGFNEQGQSGTTISCVSSSDQATTRTDLGAPLTDFGMTGTSVRAPAGFSATATFLAKRSGDPDPATTFSLAVAGGPPGASVQLDRSSVSLGGDAITPVLATVSVPAAAPNGSYPLTLTATAPGKPTRTATSTVTVAPLPSQPDTTPPQIGSALLTHTRFRVARGPTALVARFRGRTTPAGTQLQVRPSRAATALSAIARAKRRTTPAGTQLRVRLSEAATLTLTIQRVRTGHRSGRACSLRARRGRRCTVAKTAGTLTRRLRAGASTVALSGRIGRKALPPGSYKLVLQAADAARNRSATKTLTLAIVAR